MMAAARGKQIREYRMRQPLEELRRKAEKARNRANLYTAEELDLAFREAADLSAALRFLEIAQGPR